MQFDLLLILSLAIIPASFSMLLDYALGFPGKEQVNPKAIFFSYSMKLAKNALNKSGRVTEVLQNLEGVNDNEVIDLTFFMEGRKHFTYEQVLGMCSYCTNFWLSVLASFIMIPFVPLGYISNFLLVLLIPIFSHLYLRILKNN